MKPDADVEGFEDQDELLEEAEKNGCDVVFLDIHMPGMNGVEVAKRLKEINRKMNIIFVTGFSDYKGDAMDMKASGYIMKPVMSASSVPKQRKYSPILCIGTEASVPCGRYSP